MKVLLVFEREYRVYIEAVAEAIRIFRSNIEVVVTDSANLEAEVERFDPQLVISSSPIPNNPVEPGLITSIELSPNPSQPSRFRVGERHWEPTNPTLGQILSAVDETKGLYRTLRGEGPTNTDRAEDP